MSICQYGAALGMICLAFADSNTIMAIVGLCSSVGLMGACVSGFSVRIITFA